MGTGYSETGSVMKSHLADAHDACQECLRAIEQVLDDPPVKSEEIVQRVSRILKPLHTINAELRGMKRLAGDLLSGNIEEIDSQLSTCLSLVEHTSTGDPVRFILALGQLLDPMHELCELITSAEKLRFENSNMRRA